MALYLTPAEHDANPPSTWKVVKIAPRIWQLQDANGAILETLKTKREAEEARTTGFCAKLYDKEGRWFKGETVDNWKPYVQRTFNVMYNVGRSKYVVNYHDGQKTHQDGSPFFDIRIFKNQKALATFTGELKKQGFVES